jgi:hypothetical protein
MPHSELLFYRAKIKARDDYLPKRIAAQEQRADDLIKAAKGLGGKIK